MAVYQKFDPLARLAPLVQPPVSYRRLRYDGDGMDVALDDFPLEEAALVRRMYANLGALLPIVRDRSDDQATFTRVRELYRERGWAALNFELTEMRGAPHGVEVPPQMRQVLHDIKGGGYTGISAHLQLIAMRIEEAHNLDRLFFLCRDQMKIMRNAIRGLDEERYVADLAANVHSTALLVEKWQEVAHQAGKRTAEVTIDCRYEGGIAERCLEFSALDRVLYNLVNNAVVNTADAHVTLALEPAEAGDEPVNLRFAVANRVSAEQQRMLSERFPAGPGELFHGGFTTSGSGLGLRICADFVCNAYGLGGVEQGLAEGHFGAIFADDHFIAWFHWPIAAE